MQRNLQELRQRVELLGIFQVSPQDEGENGASPQLGLSILFKFGLTHTHFVHVFLDRETEFRECFVVSCFWRKRAVKRDGC